MCACGRGLPLLQEIQGRSTDFVVAADGTVMHGLALIYVLRDLQGIAAFKIIQESRTLTAGRESSRARDLARRSKAAVVQGLRARLGAQATITVEEVSGHSAGAVGKVSLRSEQGRRLNRAKASLSIISQCRGSGPACVSIQAFKSSSFPFGRIPEDFSFRPPRVTDGRGGMQRHKE